MTSSETQHPNNPPPDAQPAAKPSRPHYTVFIRLPFQRNGFEDPPPVEWDATKDRALWKLISKASNSKEINWEEMSVKFNVSLAFLLKQAAWLYERHFEGMRLQMKKLGVAAVAVPKSPLESESATASAVGAVGMVRTGSKEGTKPTPITSARGSPLLGTDTGSTPDTPRLSKPGISRTASASTVTQSRMFASTSKQPLQRALRGSSGSQNPPTAALQTVKATDKDGDESALSNDGTSDSESDNNRPSIAQSQIQRRSQLSRKPFNGPESSDGDAEDGDDDDDDDGNFPIFATSSKTPSAALNRSQPRKQTVVTTHPATSKPKTKPVLPDSPTSSASSAQQQPSSVSQEGDHNSVSSKNERPGPLSPGHRAQLEHLSPGYKKSGSDGSPSMGSSFSDLDDSSVTQSALEDALLSNMQRGSVGMGIGSRMNSLRDVLGRK